MLNWIAKKHLKFRFRQFIGVILITSLTIVVARIGLTQGTSPTPATPQITTASPQRINSDSIPSNRVYFADILVRGQPVFQVGSLSDLSASDRAQIVNRRIKSVLAQPDFEGAVTVEPDPQRGIAILKFSAVITNNTVSGKRRTSVSVGITYDTDINTVKKILNDTVLKVVGVEPEPKPITLVRELGTTEVNVEVRFWVNSQPLAFIEMTS